MSVLGFKAKVDSPMLSCLCNTCWLYKSVKPWCSATQARLMSAWYLQGGSAWRMAGKLKKHENENFKNLGELARCHQKIPRWTNWCISIYRQFPWQQSQPWVNGTNNMLAAPPFRGATNTPVLDFWWYMLWVSKPEWILSVLSCLCNPQIHLWCHTCYTCQSIFPKICIKMKIFWARSASEHSAFIIKRARRNLYCLLWHVISLMLHLDKKRKKTCVSM